MINLIQPGFELVFELVAQIAQPLRFLGHFALADRARFAQPDDARHVQRARTHAALVAAAIHLRGDLHARTLPPDIKRADALRPVELVRRDRHQVDVVLD